MLILKCLAQTTFSWFTRIKCEHIINFKWYTWTTNLNFYSNEVFIHFVFEKCQEKFTSFHTHTNTWENKILNFLSSQMIVSSIWKMKWQHISLRQKQLSQFNSTLHISFWIDISKTYTHLDTNNVSTLIEFQVLSFIIVVRSRKQVGHLAIPIKRFWR